MCSGVLAARGGVERRALLIEARPAMTAALTQSHFGIPWMLCLPGVAPTALGSARRGYAARLPAAAGKAARSHAADAGDFTLPGRPYCISVQRRYLPAV
jgi:hypothetical protein